MYCRYCGKELEQPADSCPHCHKTLAKPQPQPQPEEPAPEPPQSQPQPEEPAPEPPQPQDLPMNWTVYRVFKWIYIVSVIASVPSLFLYYLPVLVFLFSLCLLVINLLAVLAMRRCSSRAILYIELMCLMVFANALYSRMLLYGVAFCLFHGGFALYLQKRRAHLKP